VSDSSLWQKLKGIFGFARHAPRWRRSPMGGLFARLAGSRRAGRVECASRRRSRPPSARWRSRRRDNGRLAPELAAGIMLREAPAIPLVDPPLEGCSGSTILMSAYSKFLRGGGGVTGMPKCVECGGSKEVPCTRCRAPASRDVGRQRKAATAANVREKWIAQHAGAPERPVPAVVPLLTVSTSLRNYALALGTIPARGGRTQPALVLPVTFRQACMTPARPSC